MNLLPAVGRGQAPRHAVDLAGTIPVQDGTRNAKTLPPAKVAGFLRILVPRIGTNPLYYIDFVCPLVCRNPFETRGLCPAPSCPVLPYPLA